MHRGQAPPPAYAPIALELLDAADAERDRHLVGRNARIGLNVTVYGIGLASGAFLLGLGGEEDASLGAILVGYFATLLLSLVVGIRHAQRGPQMRPAAREATLQSLTAEAAPPGEPPTDAS